MQDDRQHGLDALRGIAAFLVLFGHAAPMAGNVDLSICAYLAVDLFFVLSGYVMARCYERKLADKLSETEFLIIRLKRIWPTMAVGAILSVTLWWVCFPLPATMVILLLSTLLFIPNLTPGQAAFPLNVPVWSILFELVANFLHATVFRHLNARQLIAIALVSVSVIMLFQVTPNSGWQADGLWLGMPRVLVGYCIGIVIWRLQQGRTFCPVWPVLIAFPIAVVLASGLGDSSLWVDWLFMLVIAPLCVLLGGARVAWPRMAAWAGELSFPLYAVHSPVIVFTSARGYGMVVGIAASILASIIVWHLTARFRRSGKRPVTNPSLQLAESAAAKVR